MAEAVSSVGWAVGVGWRGGSSASGLCSSPTLSALPHCPKGRSVSACFNLYCAVHLQEDIPRQLVYIGLYLFHIAGAYLLK